MGDHDFYSDWRHSIRSPRQSNRFLDGATRAGGLLAAGAKIAPAIHGDDLAFGVFHQVAVGGAVGQAQGVFDFVHRHLGQTNHNVPRNFV